MSQPALVDSHSQSWQLYGGEAKRLQGGTELKTETQSSRQSFHTASDNVFAFQIFDLFSPSNPVPTCRLC